MDILKTLTEFIAKEYGGEALGSIVGLLAENNFDIKRTLSSLSPEKVAPILKEFIKSPAFTSAFAGFNGQKESPPFGGQSGQGFGVSPISEIADKKVVEALNNYFESGEN